MKLQTKNERWQCAIASFAMALDVPLADLIKKSGHDGSAVLFPDNPEPSNRAGHCIYELIELALDLEFSVTPVALFPAHANSRDPKQIVPIGTEAERWLKFNRQILISQGTIECNGPRWNHMVAYDQGRIYDPDGNEFSYSREELERRSLFPVRLLRIDKI